MGRVLGTFVGAEVGVLVGYLAKKEIFTRKVPLPLMPPMAGAILSAQHTYAVPVGRQPLATIRQKEKMRVGIEWVG